MVGGHVDGDEPHVLTPGLQLCPPRHKGKGVLAVPGVPDQAALLEGLGGLVFGVHSRADLAGQGRAGQGG